MMGAGRSHGSGTRILVYRAFVDNTPRTLTFYNGNNNDATNILNVTATLSDGLAPGPVMDLIGATVSAVTTITYQAASPRQWLTLTYTYAQPTPAAAANAWIYGLTLRNSGLLQAPPADSIGIQFPGTGTTLSLQQPAGVVPRIGWNAMPAVAVSTALHSACPTGQHRQRHRRVCVVESRMACFTPAASPTNQGNFRLMNGNLDHGAFDTRALPALSSTTV